MDAAAQPLPDTCLPCHECGLVVDLGGLMEGRRAECPRCGCVLSHRRRQANVRIVAFCLSALICLGASLAFDFIDLVSTGIERDLTLSETISTLFTLHEWTLAAFMCVVVIGLPLSFLLALGALALSLELGKAGAYSVALLRFITFVRAWNMAEIFFLSVLISMVKIAKMAQVSLGPSFWFYGLFILFLVLSLAQMDQYQLGLSIRRLLRQPSPSTGPNPPPQAGEGWGGGLDTTTPPSQPSPASGGRSSLQRCWSLWLTGLIFYIPANLLPIMRTTQVGGSIDSTIAGGVALLWDNQSYMIASIIFIASLLVPPAKFVAIAALALCQRHRGLLSPAAATSVYRFTEFVGRWSMVDVFVVGFLAALIQMGNLMNVVPGPAALAFGGMVWFTMLAAHSLDPRVFWTSSEAAHE